MYSAYEQPATFVDSTADKPFYLTAPDLNVLRTNAWFLDGLSQRWRQGHTDQITFLDRFGGNPCPLFAGSFQFRTGMTTLTFKAYQWGLSGQTHTLTITVNGVVRHTVALQESTAQTINLTMTAWGFTDYQIVDVKATVSRTVGVEPGYYRMQDAYVGPFSATYTTSWPGVPTFGAITAANLNQLANAQIHLMERINQVPIPGFMTTFLYPMHQYVSERNLWEGSLSRAANITTLYIVVKAFVVTNLQERLRVQWSYPTSVTVYGPTWTSQLDNYNYAFGIDVSSWPIDVPVTVTITQEVLAVPADNRYGQPSRYSLFGVFTGPSALSQPTLPALMQPLDQVTFATLQTRLNQIATATLNAYNRVINAPDIFNRVRLFRHSPAPSDEHRTFQRYTWLSHGSRVGDALWVRGKNVTISYGVPRLIRSGGERDWQTEFQYEESLISGDTVADKLIYLDSLKGLHAGMDYWIGGDDLRYVGAHIQ